MRNFLIFITVSANFLFGCKEIGPEVDFTDRNISVDSNYVFQGAIPAAQNRIILLEEFTGVRCVACPTAHEIIRTIEAAHPNRIVAVGIHAGFQAVPFSGRPDYRIPEGAAIENLLGGVQGYPQGAVDRLQFSQEPRINTGPGKWEGYVNQRLPQAVIINLQGQASFNPQNRTLSLTVRSHALEPINESVYLTVGLIESDIIDWQTTPNGVVEDYKHDHILRALLTPFNGSLQANTLQANQVIVKKFIFQVPNNVKPDNAKWYAALHFLGNKKDVLQAAYGKLN